MSNLNGEDQKTTEKIPTCTICDMEAYIEHQSLPFCSGHYEQVTGHNRDGYITYEIEDIKLFRSFFGIKRKYSKLTLEQVIEIKKTQALIKLARILDFAKDQDGALYINKNWHSEGRY